jgi:hypothetical protein
VIGFHQKNPFKSFSTPLPAKLVIMFTTGNSCLSLPAIFADCHPAFKNGFSRGA